VCVRVYSVMMRLTPFILKVCVCMKERERVFACVISMRERERVFACVMCARVY